MWFICIFKKDFLIFLFTFRERGREGQKYQCVRDWIASHIPRLGTWSNNPGMCPDWGIKLAISGFAGRCSIHWATTAGQFCIFKIGSIVVYEYFGDLCWLHCADVEFNFMDLSAPFTYLGINSVIHTNVFPSGWSLGSSSSPLNLKNLKVQSLWLLGFVYDFVYDLS